MLTIDTLETLSTDTLQDYHDSYVECLADARMAALDPAYAMAARHDAADVAAQAGATLARIVDVLATR